MEQNVYEILEQSAARWPDRPAVHDEHGTMTFAELLREAAHIKNKLHDIGLGPGMGVGLMARNGRNFISGMLGACGTGAVVMPLSHQLKPAEIEIILADARIHFLLDDYSGVDPMEQRTSPSSSSYSHTDIELPEGKFRVAATGVPATEIFAPHVTGAGFMRYTSGTTGKSKGVIVSHRSVIERVDAANKALQLGPEDCVVWVLPMAYHFLVSIVLYIRVGAAIAVCRDFLAQSVIEYTNKFRGTLLYASPMHIRLLSSDATGATLTSLKRVISTSTGISLETCQAFKNRFGIDVSQAYGIIEIGLPIINFSKSADHPNAVGHALPDYEVEIVDEHGTVLPPDTSGHLAIRGPGMFDAYLKPPQTRSEVLKHGWFYTADFAVKSASGLVTVLGREKSMINVSGNKVFAEEVEAVLDSHPSVKASRIYGVAHPLMGEIIQAEIIPEGTEPLDPEELLRYCRQRLSTFKLPQRIRLVTELPMTGSGKIARHQTIPDPTLQERTNR